MTEYNFGVWCTGFLDSRASVITSCRLLGVYQQPLSDLHVVFPRFGKSERT